MCIYVWMQCVAMCVNFNGGGIFSQFHCYDEPRSSFSASEVLFLCAKFLGHWEKPHNPSYPYYTYVTELCQMWITCWFVGTIEIFLVTACFIHDLLAGPKYLVSSRYRNVIDVRSPGLYIFLYWDSEEVARPHTVGYCILWAESCDQRDIRFQSVEPCFLLISFLYEKGQV